MSVEHNSDIVAAFQDTDGIVPVRRRRTVQAAYRFGTQQLPSTPASTYDKPGAAHAGARDRVYLELRVFISSLIGAFRTLHGDRRRTRKRSAITLTVWDLSRDKPPNCPIRDASLQTRWLRVAPRRLKSEQLCSDSTRHPVLRFLPYRAETAVLLG
jgi:hypothetical protein